MLSSLTRSGLRSPTSNFLAARHSSNSLFESIDLMTETTTATVSSKWSFAWKQQRSIIACACAAVVLTTLVVKPWQPQPQLGWWQWMDAICGVATLAVALIVWWGELTETWERSLPKRLRVVFEFEGNPALICEDAPLASEADMRALAQQIGRQMNDNRDLKLRTFSEPASPVIRSAGSQTVRQYELILRLRELPETLVERRQKDPAICKGWRVVDGVEHETFYSPTKGDH